MSKKKVYDIVPPKVVRKIEQMLAAMPKEDKKINLKRKKYSTKKPVFDSPIKNKFAFKEILIGALVVVLLLAIYAILKLPKAEITIKPKLETVMLGQTITADKTANSIDFTKRVIPAFYLQETGAESAQFDATGTISNDQKAEGTITIYNKLDPATPFTLIKGTHFLSNSGKYFITLDKVTIPAAKWQKGKLVPGSIDIKVQAKEAGDSFNIGPSSFSIPKLSGTVYYYSIIADSENSMAGGRIGEVKKVTDADLQSAKDSLSGILVSRAMESFKKSLPENEYEIEEFAVLVEFESFQASAKKDQLQDNFTVTAKMKISALAFKKEDLKKLAEEQLKLQLPEYKNLVDGSLAIENISQNPDVLAGKISMNLNLSAKSYFTVDSNDLINLFPNKKESEISEMIGLRHGENILETKIDFWPFWVSKAPQNKNRIKIELLFK